MPLLVSKVLKIEIQTCAVLITIISRIYTRYSIFAGLKYLSNKGACCFTYV